ncbi:heme oxygenase-like [Ctenocephalides felis]|uniref:heme oxygenase-like n=1 Tax=Ctenocephalides felis TaxID=7515 RepID=UPI000E6E4728|nr:heme oxygenase-like [Ctenocephalides felis]
MTSTTRELFTRRMKKETRDVHAISDALVNAKLAFALSDQSVWAEGLLVFYEIFKYLERNVDHPMLCTSLRRIDAFEKDLEFYLGKDWKKTYVIRESVANYLNHLHYLADNNKILLLVYVYHLYMGLLSGGQILRKKRAYSILPKRTKTKNIPGEAVTDFEGANLYNLKKKLRDDMDNEARKFSESTKQLFITESKKLFLMNNK